MCLGLFSVSSILCAQAWNLDSLLLFRILQGLAGGGMVPVSQSILADAFPPQKRGQAFALFGVAVVVAPVVGPTLGGWLADNLTWRWCFLINGPVGLATIALIAILLPADKPNQGRAARFDVIGFLLVATFLGALEIVLDRGLEDDWFGSNFIVTFTVICAVAFVLMIPWELSRSDPMIDQRQLVRFSCFGERGLAFAILGVNRRAAIEESARLRLATEPRGGEQERRRLVAIVLMQRLHGLRGVGATIFRRRHACRRDEDEARQRGQPQERRRASERRPHCPSLTHVFVSHLA